jgi:putative addiction module CopG family antidote
MPVEQMNISLSPHMARFIRGKVKRGEYMNSSKVVRDAVGRMQESDAA